MTLVNPDDPNDTIESFDVAEVCPIGTHPAAIMAITPLTMDTRFGANQKLIEWTFEIAPTKGDKTYTETILTSRERTPRSKLTKVLAAAGVALGETAPPDQVIGKPVLVVVGEDDNGYPAILEVVAPV